MPPLDRSGQGAGEPAQNAFPISPDDVAELPFLPRAIWVGAAGTLTVVTIGGDTVTFVGVPAGAFFPIRAKKVMLTGTTASALIGVY